MSSPKGNNNNSNNFDGIPNAPSVAFPQSGWHQIELYAAAFGQTRTQVVRSLKKYDIPSVNFGHQILVKAEDMIDRLLRLGGNLGEKEDE